MPKTLKTLGDAQRTGQDLLAICHGVRCRHRQRVDLQTVIKYVGEMHPLVPVRLQVHFSERMRCPACQQRGMYIWLGIPKEPEPFHGTLSYQVQMWAPSGELDKTLAKVGHLQVAHSAYEGALRAYPTRHITLQQSSLLIRDSRWQVIEGGKS